MKRKPNPRGKQKSRSAGQTAARKKKRTGARSRVPGGHRTSPRFRWINFRGFEDTGTITIRPLTIIIGANNSGKSSLLAPLLLLKQTIESPDATVPLLTKGDLAHAGTFADFVFRRDTARTVSLKVFSHWHSETPTHGVIEGPPGGFEVKLGYHAAGTTMVLLSLSVFDTYERLYFERSRTADGSYSFRGPLRDHIAKPETKHLLAAIMKSEPTGFLFPDVYDLMWSDHDRVKAKPSAEELEAIMLYSRVMGRVHNDLRQTLDAMTYIGPMRDRPLRFYEHTGAHPRSVGPRGEFACEIFFRERAKIGTEINNWFAKFGLGETIETREISHDVFAVELSENGEKHNLADAGFGISQLLPILVEGYRSGSRGMLVKQPEIHLNPRQQCVLADLLIELVRRERTVCIETHSEHILLSLRRLIAEEKIDSGHVALYYVERLNGASSVREVPIQPNGHIVSDEWPTGFMGDALTQALALATAQSSKRAGAKESSS
jgi:hypothetical protein